MAPEQADGSRVTHHCDLYSLGGLLYALLAGRPPFHGKSMLETLQMQRFSEPEPVRRYAHATPAELEQIISQLLNKEPGQRFPNALMVARRLEAMERALTLREQEVKTPRAPIANDDFALKKQQLVAYEDVSATIDSSAPVDDPGATRVDDNRSVSLPGTSATGEDVAETDREVRPALRTISFTTIEEERQAAERLRHTEHPLAAAPTWLLIASLFGFGLLVYYFMQPPSADALFARIDTAAAEDDDRKLLGIADEVTDFVDYYPDDPRTSEVLKYERRIRMVRLERTARARARNLQRQYSDSPIAAEYLAAIELAEIDPDQAATRLQAMVNLYAVSQDEAVSVFVEAARDQLPRIREKVRQRAASQLAWVHKRLRDVDAIIASDPQHARIICQSVIELYHDRPWAAEAVAMAQQRLDSLDKTAGSNSPN